MIAADTDWTVANQRALSAEIGRLRVRLERHAGIDPSAVPRAIERSVTTALDVVCERFALSPFERDILALCAGVELDGRLGDVCAQAHGDPARGYPTFGLALAAFEGAHWSALAPHGPLRGHGLVELGPGQTLAASPLRVNEALLHELAGIETLDAALRGILHPLEAGADIVPSHARIAARVAEFFTPQPLPARRLMLTGADADGKHNVIAAAALLGGYRAFRCSARSPIFSGADQTAFVRAWSREARLRDSMLLVEAHGVADAAERALLARTVELLVGRVAIAVRNRQKLGELVVPALAVERPERAEQRELWSRSLGAAAERAATLDRLVEHFDLSASTIAASATLARSEPGANLMAAAWSAARASARGDLDDVALLLDARVERTDVVLPPSQRTAIDDIIAHVHGRATVYERWGMNRGSPAGTGVGALFFGPSGTGKTLAAGMIATELALDLYRVDLSQVVSKYIGETEKVLSRVFDAAEQSGAVLLFDECDALFGKRGEINAAHDRYANVEVSYLLARMESYRGVAILTTNLRGAIDPAFLRRLRFVVPFPFPDLEQRVELWQRAFPAHVPRVSIDVGKLARLHVAGGSIRNIAIYAASLAANAGEPVTMAHLLRAAQAECVKIERAPTSLEIGGWI